MDTHYCRQIAASIWTQPNTKHLVMIPELAEEFAVMLHSIFKKRYKTAFTMLKKSIQEDHGYAIGWYSNVAVFAKDEGVDHNTAQKIANRFMQSVFDVFYDGTNFTIIGQIPSVIEVSCGTEEVNCDHVVVQQ